MIVPNSSGEIRSWVIPFSAILIVVSIILFNVYVFISFTTQVWQIKRIHKEITTKNHQISKLVMEQQAIKPTLQRSYQMIDELNRIKTEREKIEKTWRTVQKKTDGGRIRVIIRVSQQPYMLRSGGEEISEIEELNQNFDQLNDYLQVEKELQKTLLADLKISENKLSHIPTEWPLQKSIITSFFGWRIHPVKGYTKKHEGVDLKAKIGTKVFASASGVVSFSGYQRGYGYLVIINHDSGYETRYGHNSKLLINKGQKVRKGQVISLSGNSGVSTGPHVHFEIRLNGKTINPQTFLDR